MVLSKDWLSLDATTKVLAKHLSIFISLNFWEHLEYLRTIGLYGLNTYGTSVPGLTQDVWLKEVFEDRCYSNIHSFEPLYDETLRITYQISIFARTQTITNQFNKTFLVLKLV